MNKTVARLDSLETVALATSDDVSGIRAEVKEASTKIAELADLVRALTLELMEVKVQLSEAISAKNELASVKQQLTEVLAVTSDLASVKQQLAEVIAAKNTPPAPVQAPAPVSVPEPTPVSTPAPIAEPEVPATPSPVVVQSGSVYPDLILN